MLEKDEKFLRKITTPIPNTKQLNHMKMEFYGFIHYGINTYTNKEWGNGKEDISLFNPETIDVNQWVKAAKDAGMKGLILTCKHHDGFCLWPSKYSEYTIKNTSYKNGKGDLLKEFSDACCKANLKVGVYISPWDRNNNTYGLGKAYDDYFIHQLEEVLTNYGEIFTVWLDGACGKGENSKVQQYDWPRYYEVIRKLQPNATISICGPDIRWCGNEAGKTRKYEWNVLPKRMCDCLDIIGKSQKEDNPEFRLKPIDETDLDLGSEEKLRNEQEFIWYPSEVDVSIRPGWFYHPEEDNQVKSFEELKDIYLRSVGGNTTLLLNIPPNKEGKIAEVDVKVLQQLGNFIKTTFSNNLIKLANISSSECTTNNKIDNINFDDYNNFYQADTLKNSQPFIKLEWEEGISCKYIVLKEQILRSQHISEFEVICIDSNNVEHSYRGNTIGYKKIIEFDDNLTDIKTILIKFLNYRLEVNISFIGVY